MSDDIKPGDVVVCVEGEDLVLPEGVCDSDSVFEGEILCVSDAYIQWDDISDDPYTLWFETKPMFGYPSCFFRKLLKASEEFTEQMRACKPQRVTA